MCRKKRKQRKRNHFFRATETHHPFSSKRFPHLKDEPSNQVLVGRKAHRVYHKLFGTRTPREIIKFLRRNFWTNTRRLEKNKRTNVHHVYSQKRFPHLKHCKENRVIVFREEHRLYHILFGSRTPEEILMFLREKFWRRADFGRSGAPAYTLIVRVRQFRARHRNGSHAITRCG